MAAELIRIDPVSRLYVIQSCGGYSCLGFDVINTRALRIGEWLAHHGIDVPFTFGDAGTEAHYTLCTETIDRARAYCTTHRTRCQAELEPLLCGLEGLRVEAKIRYGNETPEVVRFQVGKTGGWLPVHLMLHNARSTGGDPVTRGSIVSVRAVDRRRPGHAWIDRVRPRGRP